MKNSGARRNSIVGMRIIGQLSASFMSCLILALPVSADPGDFDQNPSASLPGISIAQIPQPGPTASVTNQTTTALNGSLLPARAVETTQPPLSPPMNALGLTLGNGTA